MIEVKNLTKKYGSYVAVDDISFTVHDGEVVGFLGPNGAGKTTTMNMMTGFISSTSGTVRINGYEILEDPINAKKQLGYMPDVPPIYADMTVKEYLGFVCDIKKVKKSDREEMLKEICVLTGITEVYGRICKNLSKGYRQRVGLAQALVGFPDVLILDEPTVGLDPKQIIEIRSVIKRLAKKHTVILSSHILSEVSAVCDRVIIINKGKIVASDTTQALTGYVEGSSVIVEVAGEDKKAIDLLSDLECVLEVKVSGGDKPLIRVTAKDGKDIRREVFDRLAKFEIPVLTVKSASPTLEEAFLKVISGEADEYGVKKIEDNPDTEEEN